MRTEGEGGKTNGRPYPNGEGEWREKVLRQLIVDLVEEVVLSLLSFLYSSVFLSLHPPSPAAMRRERGCSRGGSGKKTVVEIYAAQMKNGKCNCRKVHLDCEKCESTNEW